MLEINKIYSSQELSEEMGISYGRFRNKLQMYEKYLSMFYHYTILHKGNAVNDQIMEFMPYREYNNTKRKK